MRRWAVGVGECDKNVGRLQEKEHGLIDDVTQVQYVIKYQNQFIWKSEPQSFRFRAYVTLGLVLYLD